MELQANAHANKRTDNERWHEITGLCAGSCVGLARLGPAKELAGYLQSCSGVGSVLFTCAGRRAQAEACID